MSVRTHAPECAKTQALAAVEVRSPGGTPCTCGAQYEPGLEGQLASARREIERLTAQFDAAIAQRDEARSEAEDAVRFVEEHHEHHPWSKVPLLWLRESRRGTE